VSWLVLVNALAQRNIFHLTEDEADAWWSAAGLRRTLWIDSAAIKKKVARKQKRDRNRGINFAPPGPMIPIEQHPIFLFVDEVVRQGAKYQDTTLYRSIQHGSTSPALHVGPGARTRLGSDADFEAYSSKCLALADSIARHGVIDVHSPEWARLQTEPGERNINVYIDDDGQVAHYTCGKHRLAVAKALNISRLPVEVYSVSGRYFRRHCKPWQRAIPLEIPG
jgi:hypothetical protein